MKDPLAILFHAQDRFAEWLAFKIRRAMLSLLRPIPTYIPRHPMSEEEQERVRRRPEHSTETTDQ